MLVFVVIFILILIVLQRKSLKNHNLAEIKYDYTVSKRVVEIGEKTEFVSTITNESRKFIPFVRTVEILPEAKVLNATLKLKKELSNREDFHYESTTFLTARSKLIRHTEVVFEKRGVYLFKGATLFGGDLLGLRENNKKVKKYKTVVVYPRIIKSVKLDKLMGGLIGDLSVKRFIMEDPILTIGTRDYTGREPLKQVSWKQTAKMNQLMVKQYDYTTELQVSIILDVSYDATLDDYLSDDIYESCYALTSTIVKILNHQKIPFEFMTNAIIEGNFENKKISTITQNLGSHHLSRVLELLGRGGYGAEGSFEDLMNAVKGNRTQNQSIIVITSKRNKSKIKQAHDITDKTARSVIMIYQEDFD